MGYKFANIAKDHLENLAYRVDCLGNSKVSKKVKSDQLFDMLIEKTLKEYSQNRPDTTYSHAFNTMISIFENNEDVFKINVETDQTFISSRFQSIGSCLLTKYHFKPYNRERDPKKTITELTTLKEEEETQSPQVTEPSSEKLVETPKPETPQEVLSENVKEETKPTTTPSETTPNLETETTPKTVDETTSTPQSETPKTVDEDNSF